ncbi:MAG: hypothetical protein CMM50_09840 [Rhodospirillaceae bacterium]|nr:hypothetical protein [Rhodospirillaceae bacterium]
MTADDRLHPQAAALVAQVATSGLPPSYAVPPAEGRRIVVERARRFFGALPAVARSHDDWIVWEGRAIPMRIHQPLLDGNGDEALPVIVYFHGGGWVLGSLDSHDHGARALCAAAGAIVISVGYRRAPEHPFPAAAEDADIAVRWAETSGPSIGGDPSRIVVAGDSSGGNLAAVAALAARERDSRSLRMQVLICPALDAGCDSPSFTACADAPFLSAEGMRWFWETYLAGSAETAREDWHASPMAARNLAGLPPALLLAAGVDPLRDEAAAYAERLVAAGVPATLRTFEGMPHGFFQAQGVLDDARTAAALAGRILRKAFAKP